MLVLALLFVPVMADAGNPREAEFSPPANEGVTIAAAAAGLGGWQLYVAGNPEKIRRVEAVAGTMGHCFNPLPGNRPSTAASTAAGARLAVAPDFPLNGSGSATSVSAVPASVSTTVPHRTSHQRPRPRRQSRQRFCDIDGADAFACSPPMRGRGPVVVQEQTHWRRGKGDNF